MTPFVSSNLRPLRPNSTEKSINERFEVLIGDRIMKKVTILAFAVVGVTSFSDFASAQQITQQITVTVGRPLEVFADPTDVVIGLDTAGSCGSKFFHIQRSSVNFKEFAAIALT